MSLIDFVLNIASLLLWLNWRAIRFDPLMRATPATLAGTLRRAAPPKLKRWHFLAALGALLFLRALFYRQLGPAVGWTPRLDLGVITLPFRADFFSHELVFSALSFLHTLLIFHFWLLALTVISGRGSDPDPVHKMLQLQLGRTAHWPRSVQISLPLLIVPVLWLALHPLLSYINVVSPTRSPLHLVEQALLIGAGMYFSLKFVLPAFLFLHLIASYVYLGSSPFWDFVAVTSRNILRPLNRIPLRFGKFDFAPLLQIVLIVLLLHALPRYLQFQLNQRNLTIWPH
jgi:uncharacterized protein YggT (Ycf19 family)